MIGAIVGDIIGSVYEFNRIKIKDFTLFKDQSKFTDDTVLTIATADCILNGKAYGETFKEYGRNFPDAGYGGRFADWLWSDSNLPYNSFGNGSAMRVSPVGFACKTLDEVLAEAKRTAAVTHNHTEGIKGAQATASAIFLARTGKSKHEIRDYIERIFSYDLHATLAEIRPGYSFDETCQRTVPQAIVAFLESGDYEDAIRNAISLGGDSDTIACITGGIAQAYYRIIPDHIIEGARKLLPASFLEIVDLFSERYPCLPK